VELTKQEQRIAEVAARRYHRFLYRRNQRFQWLGLVIFLVALSLSFISKPPPPKWCIRLLANAGFFCLMVGIFGQAMSTIGKLHERVAKLDQELQDTDTAR